MFEGKKKISRVQDIIDKVADIHSQEVVQLDRVREHGRLLSVAKYFQHADEELLQVLRG